MKKEKKEFLRLKKLRIPIKIFSLNDANSKVSAGKQKEAKKETKTEKRGKTEKKRKTGSEFESRKSDSYRCETERQTLKKRQ